MRHFRRRIICMVLELRRSYLDAVIWNENKIKDKWAIGKQDTVNQSAHRSVFTVEVTAMLLPAAVFIRWIFQKKKKRVYLSTFAKKHHTKKIKRLLFSSLCWRHNCRLAATSQNHFEHCETNIRIQNVMLRRRWKQLFCRRLCPVVKVSPLTLDTTALIDCVLVAALCIAAMYAIMQTIGLDIKLTHPDNNLGEQSQSRDADVVENFVHNIWARVVEDESIACRMYDLPEISVSKTNESRLPPIDCTKDEFATYPWVWPAGDTLIVTSSKGDVVCEFEGETKHCHVVSY